VRRDAGVGVVGVPPLLPRRIHVASGTRNSAERGRKPRGSRGPIVRESVLRRSVAACRSTDFDMSLGCRAFVS
jgi:hypothetical protein